MTAEGGARPRLHPIKAPPPSPTNIAPLTRGRVPYEVLVEVENPAR